ncbi:cyclase [Neosynechococcus sphagnicola sy1]|uniref:Cyclase n=1 Tax=Neosynechococcus sphagnicola sy1 TaxID=1497020 RepID=A0A098TID2_9CYAN|nr:SRPBCC family protein [Neosynechococcus sphagnicola]KGF71737.1 cyclase [Neosynechococcus sphagnicola sy1]
MTDVEHDAELEDFLEEDADLALAAESADAVDIDSQLLQQVEVWTEATRGRERKLSARIQIPYPATFVWQVLTDYEALSDFIPNLKTSRRLEHPSGGIRLEQVGTQRLLRLNFSARVVLDIEEQFLQQISFQMVEGDFKAFSGCWQLATLQSDQPMTGLNYTVTILPKRTMPVALIERRIRRDLPLNLLAVLQRVETLCQGNP